MPKCVFDYFDKIYCLTMAGRRDIYNRLRRDLPDKCESIESDEADKLRIPLLPQSVPRGYILKHEWRRHLTSAAHLDIWKQAKVDGLNTVLIIEDDTILVNWDDEVLQNAIDSLPETWRMLWIGYNYRDKRQPVKRISDHLVKFAKGADVMSCNMYAVNVKYIDEFLEYKPLTYKGNYGFVAVDVWLQRTLKESYGVIPLMSAQDQAWRGANKKRVFIENGNNMKIAEKAGKKIISFSLYGNNRVYYKGCLENARLVYPGWICRFYISQHVSEPFAEKLKELGAEVVRMESKGGHSPSLWRFLPISDPDVAVMISRDADARLGDRDKGIIDEWLLSGKKVHIIRDHPRHTMPILAGLWGYNGTRKGFTKRVHRWRMSKFGTDQKFLRLFYKDIRDEVFVHSDYVQYVGEEVHPIKSQREGDTWLGMPFGRGQHRVEIFRGLRDKKMQTLGKLV